MTAKGRSHLLANAVLLQLVDGLGAFVASRLHALFPNSGSLLLGLLGNNGLFLNGRHGLCTIYHGQTRRMRAWRTFSILASEYRQLVWNHQRTTDTCRLTRT